VTLYLPVLFNRANTACGALTSSVLSAAPNSVSLAATGRQSGPGVGVRPPPRLQ
jgi:hypothetical protein